MRLFPTTITAKRDNATTNKELESLGRSASATSSRKKHEHMGDIEINLGKKRSGVPLLANQLCHKFNLMMKIFQGMACLEI